MPQFLIRFVRLILVKLDHSDKLNLLFYSSVLLNYTFSLKHYLPQLDSLKAFEAAARHLSFSMAADELCISKGAISYQIRKLEEQVQCTLFKRSIRQVYLTDAGQALLKATNSIFHELEETLHQLHGERDQASVSIAATTYVAARWLSPKVSAFNDQHPNISISLLHSVNSADFKLADVDIAIQWGPCSNKSERNKIDEFPMALFPAVSPGLLEKYSVDANNYLDINTLFDKPLCDIPLLCEDRQLDLWGEWMVSASPGNSRHLANPRRVITDANVRVQAAIDGQGFILADDLMLNEMNNRLLVRPFKYQLIGYGYRVKSPASRIFSDHAVTLKTWFTSDDSARKDHSDIATH